MRQGSHLPDRYSPGCKNARYLWYPSESGFTIIELVITLVMAAIALMLAVPSMQRISADNQVSASSNIVVSGLNFARFSAITTGDDITICPSSDGVNCGDGSWQSGWIVFSDADADGDADESEIIKSAVIEGSVSGSGFEEGIVFRSDGTTSMALNAEIVHCFARANVTDKCVAITVSAFGAIASRTTQASSATT